MIQFVIDTLDISISSKTLLFVRIPLLFCASNPSVSASKFSSCVCPFKRRYSLCTVHAWCRE